MVCSSLSVVTNHEGKCRLVLNLRHLNQFLCKDHFKYEDLRIALLMFEQSDLLMKFDLKSGYRHLDIFEAHQWVLHGSQSTGHSIMFLHYYLLVYPQHLMPLLNC